MAGAGEECNGGVARLLIDGSLIDEMTVRCAETGRQLECRVSSGQVAATVETIA